MSWLLAGRNSDLVSWLELIEDTEGLALALLAPVEMTKLEASFSSRSQSFRGAPNIEGNLKKQWSRPPDLRISTGKSARGAGVKKNLSERMAKEPKQ